MQLAKVLGVHAAYLYAEDENMAALIASYSRMSKKAQRQLLNLANAAG